MREIGIGVERVAPSASTALTATQTAWLAAVPIAVLTTAVVALLGPPVGHLLLRPGPETFWQFVKKNEVSPQPGEHGRYVVSLLGPAALAAAVLASVRWTPRLDARLARYCVVAAQIALVAFVVVCFAAQWDVLVSAYRPQWEAHVRYFRPRTLALALLVPPLLLAVMRRRTAVAAQIARLTRETSARRAGACAFAALFTAVWLLTAVDADGSLANTASGVTGHILWTMDEPFAILDGRTPLVNFHAEYGQLWPYVAAGAMSLFGASIGTFSITMAIGSGLALLALYAVLRRLLRSSLLALALYLPLVATGFFMKIGPLDNRFSPANLFSLWPIRYFGPYVLAWLLVRHLEGLAPRRVWMLFAVAGLMLINNVEFGTAGLAALAVALVAVTPPRSRRAAGRLLAEAAGGMLLAFGVVAACTLARSGSLPHYESMLEFSRLYGADGWYILPMPQIGMFLVVYVTFVAAIAVAAVRLVRRAPDVALTAMLAWSGSFGLLAGAYFAGRAHPQVLIDLFSPWALSIVLLTIVVARSLAGRGWRRPTPAELLVLFGFGLTVCSLAQTPTPWSQIARIRDEASFPVFKQPVATAFTRERTRPGEKIAVLIPLGHRIAYDAGRVNVSPYSSTESMPTRQQLARTIALLRHEGGRKLFISNYFTLPEAFQAIQHAGFVVASHTVDELGTEIVELVDRRGAASAAPARRPRR